MVNISVTKPDFDVSLMSFTAFSIDDIFFNNMELYTIEWDPLCITGQAGGHPPRRWQMFNLAQVDPGMKGDQWAIV